jgi:hypothetical protein
MFLKNMREQAEKYERIVCAITKFIKNRAKLIRTFKKLFR